MKQKQSACCLVQLDAYAHYTLGAAVSVALHMVCTCCAHAVMGLVQVLRCQPGHSSVRRPDQWLDYPLRGLPGSAVPPHAQCCLCCPSHRCGRQLHAQGV